jgi:hypothetical protein
MPKGKAFTADDIIAIITSYKETKSVWKTADILNISGQAVHAQLQKLGLIKYPNYSKEEELEIETEYKKPISEFSLDNLAKRLMRDKTGICKFAKSLGLTTKEHIKHQSSIRIKEINTPNRWENKEHPKGMLGKKHSDKAKKRIGECSKEFAKSLSEEQKHEISVKAVATKIKVYGTPAPGFANSINSYSRTKKGRREDLGDVFFRSSWEANYARYLNLLIQDKRILKWEFEPDTFIFEKEIRGAKSYMPDFKITNLDNSIEYHEVKGWMDPKSKSKLKKFAKYYPTIKLILIDSKEYRKLEKQYKTTLTHWE